MLLPAHEAIRMLRIRYPDVYDIVQFRKMDTVRISQRGRLVVVLNLLSGALTVTLTVWEKCFRRNFKKAKT
ncbi:hypothetical protein [Thermococcus sp.]